MPKKTKSTDENFQADAKNSIADQDDSVETLKQKNQDLQGLLSKVIDLLKEKTNVCINLEKQNSALNLQVSFFFVKECDSERAQFDFNLFLFLLKILSLKDIVAITKNLLGIRNVEVENMQRDLSSLQEKIDAEKERHNSMIDKIGNANKWLQ